MFLYYDTEQAMQIVNDLLEQRKLGGQMATGGHNKMDNEMKNMATRITKSQHYNQYKTARMKTVKIGK